MPHLFLFATQISEDIFPDEGTRKIGRKERDLLSCDLREALIINPAILRKCCAVKEFKIVHALTELKPD